MEKYLKIIDWLELSIKGQLNYTELKRRGYQSSISCPGYNHYFETKNFSLKFDTKGCIDDGYIHLKVANELLYRDYFLNDPKLLCNFVKNVLCRLFLSIEKIYISRIDFAFDFVKGGELYDIISQHFQNREIPYVTKYSQHIGKVKEFNYTNYTAGSRASTKYYRFYNKTAENVFAKESKLIAKKQYIKDLHDTYFGNDTNIYRFEIECKPIKISFSYDIIISKQNEFVRNYFVNGFVHPVKFGFAYENSKAFTLQDANRLERLLVKFESFFGYNFYSPVKYILQERFFESQNENIVFLNDFDMSEWEILDCMLNENELKYN